MSKRPIDFLAKEILEFNSFGKTTVVDKCVSVGGTKITSYINEYWTSKQRAAHSLHEISYRACFKPQLPRFFIDRLTQSGDVVYDPFMGRGTTPLEAALSGRVAWGCDINPLSCVLLEPRFSPPTLQEVKDRLAQIDWTTNEPLFEDLLVFYHIDTLKEISSLRNYFIKKNEDVGLDNIDKWIRMLATNRLTGHSPGFFSVYTLPPNQATSIERQRKINAKRNQVPPRRDVSDLILKKSKSLLKDLTQIEINVLRNDVNKHRLVTESADNTLTLPSNSVHLVVTSPPFLNVVQYKYDNWLRCWFNNIKSDAVNLWAIRDPDKWQEAMTGVFKELKRLLAPGAYVAFEVGEVENGNILLEENVIDAMSDAGLSVKFVIINSQEFTKTSHCWGVSNQDYGTNTNRIVVCCKD